MIIDNVNCEIKKQYLRIRFNFISFIIHTLLMIIMGIVIYPKTLIQLEVLIWVIVIIITSFVGSSIIYDLKNNIEV